jgi:hypothetical protein
MIKDFQYRVVCSALIVSDFHRINVVFILEWKARSMAAKVNIISFPELLIIL